MLTWNKKQQFYAHISQLADMPKKIVNIEINLIIEKRFF
jgi:hypothetical protein